MTKQRYKWQSLHSGHTDGELIALYQGNGNGEYVATLFYRYLDLLFGLTLKYMKNTTESEDTSYEIFEILLVKLKTHNVDNFKSWLYRLSSNYCIDKIRKTKKMSIIELSNTNQFGQEQYELATDEKEQLLIKIDSCLQRLVADQKCCIEMFYFNEKSYDEISKTLDISWSKTRSNIQNGKRNLKICMEGK